MKTIHSIPHSAVHGAVHSAVVGGGISAEHGIPASTGWFTDKCNIWLPNFPHRWKLLGCKLLDTKSFLIYPGHTKYMKAHQCMTVCVFGASLFRPLFLHIWYIDRLLYSSWHLSENGVRTSRKRQRPQQLFSLALKKLINDQWDELSWFRQVILLQSLQQLEFWMMDKLNHTLDKVKFFYHGC